MKKLFLYLLARVRGKPITWVQAGYDALNVDVETEVCSRVDAFIVSVADFFTFGRYTAKKLAGKSLNTAATKTDSFLVKFFLGRLLLCALNRRTNSEFLFSGKRATP